MLPLFRNKDTDSLSFIQQHPSFFLLYDVAHVKWGSRFSYLVEFDSLLVYVVAQVVSHMQNYSFSLILYGMNFVYLQYHVR